MNGRRAGRWGGLALALAAAGLLGRGPAGAEDQGRERIEYYDVTGATAGELRAALSRLGPLGSDGMRWDGYTAWQIDAPALDFSPAEDSCGVAAAPVPVRVLITLPRWNAPPDADPRLVQRWQKFLAALERHERGHAGIAYQAAEDIDRRLRRLGRFPTCAAAGQAAQQAVARLLGKAQERDAAYDRRTRHGARQGARFP